MKPRPRRSVATHHAANAYLEASRGRPSRARTSSGCSAARFEVLRIVAILASPALPETADVLWERIGLPASWPTNVPAAPAWGGYPGGTRT